MHAEEEVSEERVSWYHLGLDGRVDVDELFLPGEDTTYFRYATWYYGLHMVVRDASAPLGWRCDCKEIYHTGGSCAHVYVARHVSGEIDLISMTCELPKRSKVGRPTTVYGGLFVHPVNSPVKKTKGRDRQG